MDLSSAIFEWVSSLELWQQQLVRMVAATSLSESEAAIVADMVAGAFGVGSPASELRPLAEAELGLTKTGVATPRLTRLGHLRGVGAVVDDQALTFAANGLTVVYGANAAGKSSYVRVLKHACRCADRRARILANVFASSTPARRTAKIEYQLDNNAHAEELDLDETPPDGLSVISVFDTRCADVYVTGNDVIAYVPTALQLFERLASAQYLVRDELRERARSLRAARPSLPEILNGTATRTVVDGLAATSSVEALRKLASVTELDQTRLKQLDGALSLDDPDERRRRIARESADAAAGEDLAKQLDLVATALAPTAITEVRERVEQAAVAARAVSLAAEEAFAKQPVAGVGSEPWRELWETARAFCTHTSTPFPPTERCPLCAQELDENAGKRMVAFERFVHGDLERRAQTAAALRDAAVARLAPDLVARCRTRFVDSLMIGETSLHTTLSAWLDAAEARRAGAAEGAADPPALAASPAVAVRKWSAARTAAAKALADSSDPAARAALESEAREIRGRIALSPRIEEVVSYVGALGKAERFDRACRALNTRGVTDKQGQLTDLVVTETLRSKLNEEIAALDLGHLEIRVDRSGEAGTSRVRMQLEQAHREAPLEDVLSAGEHGAIGLAFFLAELGAAEQNGSVVVDDPVSSLDLQRREHIADRLTEEARRRQVIVFTHDIAFLYELRKSAEAMGVAVHEQSVWRAGAEVGRVQDDSPFHTMSVKKRIGVLEDRLVHWLRPEDEDSMDAAWSHVKTFYNDLRETWEFAVEDALLNKVVQRFDPMIQTKRLERVTISETDKADVKAGLGRCSRFAHSEPAARGMSVPVKSELASDLEALRTFVTRKNKEREAL